MLTAGVLYRGIPTSWFPSASSMTHNDAQYIIDELCIIHLINRRKNLPKLHFCILKICPPRGRLHSNVLLLLLYWFDKFNTGHFYLFLCNNGFVRFSSLFYLFKEYKFCCEKISVLRISYNICITLLCQNILAINKILLSH